MLIGDIMKKKIICLILLFVPIAVSIYCFVVFVQSALIWSKDIAYFSQNSELYEMELQEYHGYLVNNIVVACACAVAIIACIAVMVLILKKDFSAVNGSIVEQWRSYTQIRTERKAAKLAEQKQARIAELEQELEQLKNDE